MADYYIKCTEKDRDGEIRRVGYTLGLAGSVGGQRKDKSNVIRDIDVLNKDVKTAYREGGLWKIGDEVHTVNGDYIRTDGNQLEEDNLDNISSC